MIRAWKLARHDAVTKREERAVLRAENQEVLVVVHPRVEIEVLAVEGRKSFPIADGERDVIEGHEPMIAFTRNRERGDMSRLPRPVPPESGYLTRDTTACRIARWG